MMRMAWSLAPTGAGPSTSAASSTCTPAPSACMAQRCGPWPQPNRALLRTACSSRRPSRLVAAQSSPPDKDAASSQQQDLDSLKQKFFGSAGSEPEAPGASPEEATTPRQTRSVQDDQTGAAPDGAQLVNPIALGRQARRAFDEVWTQLAQLAAPTKRSAYADDLEALERDDASEAPQAASTTVLVLGATGRVGRILTRKLLLRGYKVRALVRRKPGREDGAAVEGVPAAVKVVFGDVGEMRDCQEAVRGANKVIYCAAARSTFTAELLRVEETGVRNLVKAFQDEHVRQTERSRSLPRAPGGKQRVFTDKTKKEVADFSEPYHQARWDITFLGTPEEDAASQSERSREMAKYNQAIAEINDEENLIFEGVLYQRGAVAEVGAEVPPVMAGGEHRTAQTEGLVLRLRGDGKQYACVLRTADGGRYSARFPTRLGYTHVRLPWDAFRAEGQGSPPLSPDRISYMGLRYEFRRANLRSARGVPTSAEIEELKKDRQFQLEVDWIKALPSGVEPDFILVSRAGKSALEARAPDADSGAPAPQPLEPAPVRSGPASDALKVVEFKRRGEDTLRLSGLGYTIIRPGALVEEPGGYKALVFDQGDRITESIGAADVADICLRALHEPAARNKTFDVCYEDQSEAGNEMYELVAHVPDRSNSYLKSAVASLVKNT